MCALLVNSHLPLRDFIMTILMRSPPFNFLKISKMSMKYGKGAVSLHRSCSPLLLLKHRSLDEHLQGKCFKLLRAIFITLVAQR